MCRVDVSLPDMLNWGKLFRCPCAAAAFSLGPHRRQHLHVLVAGARVVPLVLVHAVRWHFT